MYKNIPERRNKPESLRCHLIFIAKIQEICSAAPELTRSPVTEVYLKYLISARMQNTSVNGTLIGETRFGEGL